MTENSTQEVVKDLEEYKFGFHDNAELEFTTGLGLTEEVIREISETKNDPEWMLEFRLKSFEAFKKLDMPKWGPDLSGIDFNDIVYYQKPSAKAARSWEDVPQEIKDTFEKIGIPEAERSYLAGASAQYESEVVYHNMKDEFEKLGIIFTDTDSGLRDYPEIFKKYFSKLVPPTDNKLAALNSAVWSGGSFVYVPKGVKCEIPIQAYFRINNEKSGQFERTLIIVEEGASIQYVEGCTAPTYSASSLHAAVVEIFVEEGGYMRYSTIQNWSDNVYNLVTKRAAAEKNATVEWIDGNLGSKVSMKYPAVHLNGPGARGTMLSIAFAGANQNQDTGAKMIHNAPNTSSSIISKSIAKNGGAVNYRGQVTFGKNSKKSASHIECDTILMDDLSKSDTVPFNEIHNSQVALEHEAKVSKISEEQLYYLMSRGLTEKEATDMIVMGFIEPFTKELPMEYAVELNRLISYSMEGSIG
ncbi:Cysteine desulfurase activator complex, subunit SufB [Lactococcus cremoris subsp. cremoris UC509.9]|uniref:Fe-S cluster assembly protein SufB n=1 Tax=Lactococcus lactis subsp. cremoris TaxID=1359 RepID=A0AAJ6MIT8_LACLC|nr:Fe-S cluster assembly protein SufB [Lactococcus cremoris]AFW92197.1 Cysteine desulfurase activator complex, subunit SufB [Lactococcus cremoris subsp. cremoris UC509.9]ARD91934.1 Fe-S cluster assembly protein SufB [Lactococcus cremoris]MRM69127.1 Fe-S cluster assembly protein SufB [Lactococcus cremoris]QJD18598.1 Fe-S cluster assembly protein SufB [Lactococcus cremoris]QRZ30463.1 Cysteine desulfurase activator complex- subunit SufB [Lactococcus cremoris]